MKKVEMPDAMKQDVLDCATRAFTRYNSTRDIAQYIKKEFDNKYHDIGNALLVNSLVSMYITRPTATFTSNRISTTFYC